MLLAIAAGGTGGHFYPGLVVAKEFLRRQWNVCFLVKREDYVIPLLEREGLGFTTVSSAGFLRKFDVRNLVGFLKIVLGTAQAIGWFYRRRPQALVAMGGYLSVPPSLAARLFGVPIILHEQNAKPGLANRFLSRLASCVALSFAESQPYFQCPSFVTGNPIRPELEHLPDVSLARQVFDLDPTKKTVLIFGGSLGAHRMNELVAQALSSLQGFREGWQVLHLTGKADQAWVHDRYAAAFIQAKVLDYCHNMAAAYAASDIVVCRSGASTISELAAVQKPSLLIPYPFATENHQWANAKILEKWGVAKIVEQKNIEQGELSYVLGELFLNGKKIEELKRRFKEMPGTPFSAADRIFDLALRCMKEKKF